VDLQQKARFILADHGEADLVLVLVPQMRDELGDQFELDFRHVGLLVVPITEELARFRALDVWFGHAVTSSIVEILPFLRTAASSISSPLNSPIGLVARRATCSASAQAMRADCRDQCVPAKDSRGGVAAGFGRSNRCDWLSQKRIVNQF